MPSVFKMDFLEGQSLLSWSRKGALGDEFILVLTVSADPLALGEKEMCSISDGKAQNFILFCLQEASSSVTLLKNIVGALATGLITA